MIISEGLLPDQIIEIGAGGVLEAKRKRAYRAVGEKKAAQVFEAAASSVGCGQGQQAASGRIKRLFQQLELLYAQASEVEAEMCACLEQVPYAADILECKGIGCKTLAMILGETGDLLRFESYSQIVRLAGMNLVENSSGKVTIQTIRLTTALFR
ncbi:MAG: transposase [Eubacteriaceae bacterium]|nr:transposase [Eubacteriaceae bacterium]